MQTHDAKRIEIIIEAPLERRLAAVLDEAGATGYTILPVMGGSGKSGPWTRDGQVSSAGGMVAFVCLVSADRVDELLQAAFKVVEPHIGIVSVTDTQVMRPELF